MRVVHGLHVSGNGFGDRDWGDPQRHVHDVFRKVFFCVWLDRYAEDFRVDQALVVLLMLNVLLGGSLGCEGSPNLPVLVDDREGFAAETVTGRIAWLGAVHRFSLWLLESVKCFGEHGFA